MCRCRRCGRGPGGSEPGARPAGRVSQVRDDGTKPQGLGPWGLVKAPQGKMSPLQNQTVEVMKIGLDGIGLLSRCQC